MMQTMKKALADGLKNLNNKSIDDLLSARFDRILGHGRFKEITASAA